MSLLCLCHCSDLPAIYVHKNRPLTRYLDRIAWSRNPEKHTYLLSPLHRLVSVFSAGDDDGGDDVHGQLPHVHLHEDCLLVHPPDLLPFSAPRTSRLHRGLAWLAVVCVNVM